LRPVGKVRREPGKAIRFDIEGFVADGVAVPAAENVTDYVEAME
jgi:hypothetical protein